MPKRKPKETPPISNEILDALLKNYKTPEDLAGPDGLLKELKRALITRVIHVSYVSGC